MFGKQTTLFASFIFDSLQGVLTSELDATVHVMSYRFLKTAGSQEAFVWESN